MHPRAKDSVLVATTDVAVNLSIPPGEAEGVVVDAYRGTGIRGANVFVRYDGPPVQVVSTVTDEDGRFRLIGLHPGRAILRLMRIGYLSSTTNVSGDSGFVVRAGLRAQQLRACGLVIATGPEPAVTVEVRDVRTGSPPLTPVTLRLRDGNFVDSVTAIESDSDAKLPPSLGAAPGRDGTYLVDVSAPGYRPWNARHVRPIIDICNRFTRRALRVWLLPTSDAVPRPSQR